MYEIRAIICEKKLIGGIESMFHNSSKKVPLPSNLYMLPLTESTVKWIDSNNKDFILYKGFEYLSSSIVTLLLDFSKDGKVGYFEAEYFGGEGAQSSIGFYFGQTEIEKVQKPDAINVLLKFFGVKCEPGKDEFDTVELGRYRKTEEWIKNHDV